ncbi:unnamed protein product [Cuscuta campestris]|uniref:Uncharacterized protein n=1 Tax=Cuscuta campestris TaxID=132261 RepID=A0A484N289_9ASTE|nr:unnamed protein product [Cuscuta campestris]
MRKRVENQEKGLKSYTGEWLLAAEEEEEAVAVAVCLSSAVCGSDRSTARTQQKLHLLGDREITSKFEQIPVYR